MNHIVNMRKQYAANRERILQILGWDILEYTTLQYETGLQYLQNYLQMDEATARTFESNRRWWDWWVNQWNLRDAQIFLPAADAYRQNKARTMYKRVHSIAYLDGFYPHAAIMEQSYNDMTRKLYAELKNAK